MRMVLEEELGERFLGHLRHSAGGVVVVLHLADIVVAGYDDGVIHARIGVLVAVGVLVVVDVLQCHGRLCGCLQHVHSRVGEEYGLVARLLHLVHYAEHSLIHLRFLAYVFARVHNVLRRGVEVVGAACGQRERQPGGQHGYASHVFWENIHNSMFSLFMIFRSLSRSQP